MALAVTQPCGALDIVGEHPEADAVALVQRQLRQRDDQRTRVVDLPPAFRDRALEVASRAARRFALVHEFESVNTSCAPIYLNFSIRCV